MIDQIETKMSVFKNKAVILPGIIILLCNAANWIFIAYKIKPQANPIYLHYNIYYGVDLIGSWIRLYFIPATGTLVFLMNFVLALFLYKKGVYIAYIIFWVTVFLEFILLLASYLIIRQNI